MSKSVIILLLIILTVYIVPISTSTPIIYYKVTYSIKENDVAIDREYIVKLYPLNHSFSINGIVYEGTVLEIKDYGLSIELINREPYGVVMKHDIQIGEQLESYSVRYFNRTIGDYYIEFYYEVYSGILIEADIYSISEGGTLLGNIIIYNYTVPPNKIYSPETNTTPNTSMFQQSTSSTTSNKEVKEEHDWAPEIITIIFSLTLIITLITIITLARRK